MLPSPLISPLRAFLTSLTFCLAMACSGGSDDGDAQCQGEECQNCAPLTCDALGAQCGPIADGCGGTLECGECKVWEICGLDAPNVCNINCGNGAIDADEECDDGNAVTESCEYGEDYYCEVCDRFCTEGAGKLQWCGDLAVQTDQGEECDDNNDVEWDGCDLECQKNTCQFQEVFSVTRNKLRGLATSGNILYMAEDEQITIYDLSGATPQEVGIFSDASNYDMGVLAVHQGRLLIPGRGSQLSVYELSNPLAPSLVASTGTPTAAGSMHIEGNRVYLGTFEGFSIVDISNLNAPVFLGKEAMTATVYSIAASGTTVFVGTTSGVHIYDASNASDPQLISQWDPLPNDCCTTNIRSIVIDGNRMYANGGMAKLRSVDISNLASPIEIIDNLDIPGGTPGGPLLPLDSTTFLASNSAGVFAVAHSGGVLTELLGGFAATSVRHMVIRGDLVYVTADNDGFFGSNHFLKVLRVTCE